MHCLQLLGLRHLRLNPHQEVTLLVTVLLVAAVSCAYIILAFKAAQTLARTLVT